MQLDKSLFIIFLSIISFHAQGQKLGIRAGLNVSSMHIERNETFIGHQPTSTVGAHFEVLGYQAFGDTTFALETGLGLSKKGYVVSLEDNKDESDYPYEIFGRRSLTYLEIPLRGKVQKKFGKLDYFVALGPQISIGLLSKWTTEKDLVGYNTIESGQTKWNNSDDINSLKRVDFGVFGGLGVSFKSLMIELSYTGSIANTAAANDVIAKNNVFSLSVGRYFVKSVHPKPVPKKKKSKYRKVSSKKKKKKRKKRRHKRRRW